MYSYYYIKKDRLSDTWDTGEILRFLRLSGIFVEKEQGVFVRQAPFISLSLMKVKDVNSWSSCDFDFKETNYISIVTTEVSCAVPLIKGFLEEFEDFLGFKVCPEEV